MTLHNPPPGPELLAGSSGELFDTSMKGASTTDGAPKVSDGGLLEWAGASSNLLWLGTVVAAFCSASLMKSEGE